MPAPSPSPYEIVTTALTLSDRDLSAKVAGFLVIRDAFELALDGTQFCVNGPEFMGPIL